MAVVTAQEALKSAQEEQKGLNASRYVPRMIDFVKKISDENRVYIFNVGPWAHSRELGSAGRWFIKACLAGQDYSEPVIVQGIEEEPYPVNETTCTMLPKSGLPGQLSGPAEGLLLAQQILGEGPHIPKSASFAPFGVFISETATPKPKDLVRANNALQQKYLDLINEANQALAQGNDAAVQTIRPEWHFVAARAMHRSEAECPWLKGSEVGAARENCPSCGDVYSVGVMKCKCGFVLNKTKYDKAVADGLFA